MRHLLEQPISRSGLDPADNGSIELPSEHVIGRLCELLDRFNDPNNLGQGRLLEICVVSRW